MIAASMVLAAPSTAIAAPREAGQAGEWGAVMSFGVAATHQVLMHNGKVLFWRRGDEAGVWDPATGQITQVPAPFPIPPMNIHCAGQVVLADGRVLVAGGQEEGPHRAIKTAVVFDPATNTWSRVADMRYARWYPTLTALADGRALVSNGEGAGGSDRVPQVEVYDPATDTWTVLDGADRPEDLYSFNYLLPDGRIFNATPNKYTAGLTTATLDLGARRWSAGPVAHWRTGGYSESGAMYRPGKVIRAGGTPMDLASTNTATAEAEIVDMTAPSPNYAKTTPMRYPRRRHNMVLLADGTVMAVGGTKQADDPDQAVLAGEIWNPATGTWTPTAAMAEPRMYHSAALLLPDGRVLAAGGEPGSVGKPSAETAQLYSPPYLFKGARPTIAEAPGQIGYGGSFLLGTPDAATIKAVDLIRPSAVTHANDMDQRYVPLAFRGDDAGLTVAGPDDGNLAPPGWYMLVIRSISGVPSVASWVHVGHAFDPGGPPLPPGPPPDPPPPPPPPSPPPAPSPPRPAPVGGPTLSVRDADVKEGIAGKTTKLVFRLKLSSKAKGTVTVAYRSVDGTAVAGSDYVATAGTLRIKKGKRDGSISVKVTGDGDIEPDETFTVVLSKSSRTTIADGEAVGRIRNDDARARSTASRAKPSSPHAIRALLRARLRVISRSRPPVTRG